MLYGNAIVGQSGGPTAAINATLSGVIQEAIASQAIQTLFGSFHGIEGMLKDDLCDLTAIFQSEEKLRLLETTPAAALGSCRKKLPAPGDPDAEEIYGRLFDFFRRRNIRYFFYIGGNDSMDTVAKLSARAQLEHWEMRIMGVPKTIDNDVCGTDHTPGYGSAAKYIAVEMQEILRDCAVYSTRAVTIVEIMGRDAGWLTAAAALPRLHTNVAPDYVYLPERPFSFDSFYDDLETAFARHPNVVIAVSEGLRCANGQYVGESAQSGVSDAFGHKYLSGTGKALELAVKEKFGCKVRSIELNLPQRCASHVASRTDLEESVFVGKSAVEGAVNGLSGKMMTLLRRPGNGYAIDAGSADIAEIANRVRCVPDNYINERGNQVTDECLRYILPLIEGEAPCVWQDGLPVHLTIPRN